MKATRTRRAKANPKAGQRGALAPGPVEAARLSDARDSTPLPTSWVRIVYGPWCRPCWRWDLARWTRQERRDPPEEFFDEGVLEALQLIDGPASVEEATRKALRLFLDGPPVLRDAVESYVLTGEDVAVAAARVGLGVSTLEAYVRLFFDVRRCLHARDWLALQVIGPGSFTGFSPQEIGRLWKATAYHGGLHPLDAIIAVSLEDGLVDAGEGLPVPPVRLDDSTRRSVRLYVLAKTLPITTKLSHLGLLHEQTQRADALSHGQWNHKSIADVVSTRVEDLLDEMLADKQNGTPATPTARSVA